MCRKLALTGWLLIIGEAYEQARVLAALLISISFLALHLSIQPLQRLEDGAVMVLVELALIFLYTNVLLVKSCSLSSELCSTFGFGHTEDGEPKATRGHVRIASMSEAIFHGFAPRRRVPVFRLLCDIDARLAARDRVCTNVD